MSRSPKQIEAARRNGAKSRGPVTPEGKAKSSRNAITHGLSSKLVVLSIEEQDDFIRLRDEYWEHYRPATKPECDLVNDIVSARWRLERLLGIETAAMDVAIDTMREGLDERYPELDEAGRAYFAFNKLSINNNATLNQIGRYESRLRRTIEKAAAELRRLRKENLQNEPEPEPAPQTEAAPATQRPTPEPSENSQNEPERRPVSPRLVPIRPAHSPENDELPEMDL